METKKKNGDPILCKFCKKPVAVDSTFNGFRIYELDEKTLHVGNCPRRREFYKNQSIDLQQAQRDKKL